MAQYRVNHPYDPGFALPLNVMAEPPGRGTLTTAQLPRKTFFPGSRNWTGGYALPDYVMAEPQGRGTITTSQARRKTIPMKIKSPLGATPDEAALERMLEEGAPLSLAVPQEVYALDGVDDSAIPRPGFRGDPIKAYGERASEYILRTIRSVPVEFRAVALEALLNEVEPGLYDRVTERANEYKDRGMRAKEAVRAAMASSMSEGMAKEVVKLGQGKVPAMRSQMGLGFYGPPARAMALEGLWGAIKSGVKKVGSTIKSGAKKVGSTAAWPVKKLGQGIKKGAGFVKSGAQKAWEWGKGAVNKLGSLACGVMKSPLGPVAAGAAAGAMGVPPQVGVVGAQAGSTLCADSETPAAPQEELTQPQAAGTPGWVIPAAIGGAGLLAVLLMRTK